QLLWALQHHHVYGLLTRPLGRDFDRVFRPLVRLRAAEAPGSALGQARHQVAVRTLHEGRGPGAMHVPDENVHDTCSRGLAARATRSTAERASAAVTSVRQGWPGTGQM